ncbi:MAG: alcohol dehydrogenase catalytic domain-containing protein [Chloroflexi bacterium]|nr:alcohol dehydrogenase catalytic domain-containing protein [Chloroflexota bacterium]
MKAMWLVEPGRFELRDQPAYEFEADQVLVRIAYAGICPWDVRVYLGKKNVPLPRLMGHEASGIVTQVGKDVDHIRVGQRVAPDFIVKCGVCLNCRRGRANKCSNPRFPNGAYAEYAVLPHQNIHLLENATTSFESAAFMEPLACVFRGQKMLRLVPGETELVIGAGPIGLMHLQIARLFGARVMVADVLPERLALARQLGAHAILDNSNGDLKRAVMDWTNGCGADAAVVTVAASPVVLQAAECLGDGGRLNIFAGIYPVAPLPIDPNLIHYKELVLTGSADSTSQDMHAALHLIETGQVRVEELISHRLPLQQLPEGFEIVSKQQGLKVMIEIGGNLSP